MPSRAALAKAISFMTGTVMLMILWQVVRFCQGDIGAPGFDQFVSMLRATLGTQIPVDSASNPIDMAVGWFYRAMYTMGGIGTWVFIAMTVSSIGSATARIIEVGYTQYLVDCKEAQEEDRRIAQIEAARERRNELRRIRLESKKSRESFGFGTFFLGVVIGMLF